MKLADGHAVRIPEEINAMTYNIFIENLRDKRLLERPRRR
jgi:hypothetical protein